jgi:hypothetical protein
MIVLGEQHLWGILTRYSSYDHGARTHVSLAKDAPTPRRVQDVAAGEVVAFADVGGLHHRYERRAPPDVAAIDVACHARPRRQYARCRA